MSRIDSNMVSTLEIGITTPDAVAARPNIGFLCTKVHEVPQGVRYNAGFV